MRFFLILGVTVHLSTLLLSCGRTYFSISNKLKNNIYITIKSNDTIIISGSQNFFLKQKELGKISFYDYTFLSKDKISNYSFSIPSGKRIIYKAPIFRPLHDKSNLFLIVRLDTVASNLPVDTLFFLADGMVSKSRFVNKMISPKIFRTFEVK